MLCAIFGLSLSIKSMLPKNYSKGSFFSESAIHFSNLQKKYSKTILNLKFNIPAHNIILLWAGILNFKFRIVFWNIFLGRFEKQITLSEIKPPLMVSCLNMKLALNDQSEPPEFPYSTNKRLVEHLFRSTAFWLGSINKLYFKDTWPCVFKATD